MQIRRVAYNVLLIGWITIFLSFLNPSTGYAKNIFSTDRPNCLFPLHYVPHLSEHVSNTDKLMSHDDNAESGRITPYDNVLKNPNDFKNYEVGFQLNGKLLLYDIRNIYFYFHYTQQSYWQCYITSPFFRATDYKPGFFTEIPFKFNTSYLSKCSVRLGLMHQSNGLGTPNERTWNRAYGSCKISTAHTALLIKLWYIISENGIQTYNRDIGDYLGYGKFEWTYRYRYRHQIQFAARLFGKHGISMQYLFPIMPTFQLVVQGFWGYGNNIMLYNEHSYSISCGIAASDLFKTSH